MAKERSWFPDSYLDEAIASITDILAKYPVIVAYGNSMGAYAVLKFSSRLRVTHTLAFNPQFSIKPGLVKSDNRFVGYYQPSLHGDMEIDRGDVAADGELLIVASSKACPDAIETYGKRWQIETLFSCLKGRGFNLEETRVTDRTRIKRLLVVACGGLLLGEPYRGVAAHLRQAHQSEKAPASDEKYF